jgi:hypothetical protein
MTRMSGVQIRPPLPKINEIKQLKREAAPSPATVALGAAFRASDPWRTILRSAARSLRLLTGEVFLLAAVAVTRIARSSPFLLNGWVATAPKQKRFESKDRSEVRRLHA